MKFLDKVGSFLKREAKDLGDAADGAKDKLDRELTKREQELKMTPTEKIAALQQQASTTDAKLDAIADKAAGRDALADAVAEAGGVPGNASLPNTTHVVLPDGRASSGHDLPGHVGDDKGTVDEDPDVETNTEITPDAPGGPFEDANALPPPAPASTDEDALLPPPPAPANTDEDALLPPPPAPANTDEDALPPPPPAPVAEVADAEQEASEPSTANNATPAGDVPGATASDDSMAAAVEESDIDEPEPDVNMTDPAKDPSRRDYAKTPAQIKYEQARAAANDLLNELRGELKDEGQI